MNIPVQQPFQLIIQLINVSARSMLEISVELNSEEEEMRIKLQIQILSWSRQMEEEFLIEFSPFSASGSTMMLNLVSLVHVNLIFSLFKRRETKERKKIIFSSVLSLTFWWLAMLDSVVRKTTDFTVDTDGKEESLSCQSWDYQDETEVNETSCLLPSKRKIHWIDEHVTHPLLSSLQSTSYWLVPIITASRTTRRRVEEEEEEEH